MERVRPAPGAEPPPPSIAIAADWLTYCFVGDPPQHPGGTRPPDCLGCPTERESIRAFAHRQNEVGWPAPGNVDGLYHLGEPGLAYAITVAARRLNRPADLPLGEW